MGVNYRDDKWSVFTQSVDLASVAANTSATQAITITGLKVGDIVWAIGLAATAGLITTGVGQCTVADQVTMRIGNLTGSPIDQGSTSVVFVVYRPERTSDTSPNFV